MNLSIKKINYDSKNALETELKLDIAIARVGGDELLMVVLNNIEAEDLFYKACSKILRPMKRGGLIQLFLNKIEFNDRNKTETAYLINKFPDIYESINNDSVYMLIKL